MNQSDEQILADLRAKATRSKVKPFFVATSALVVVLFLSLASFARFRRQSAFTEAERLRLLHLQMIYLFCSAGAFLSLRIVKDKLFLSDAESLLLKITEKKS